jgi:hypothetical protein
VFIAPESAPPALALASATASIAAAEEVGTDAIALSSADAATASSVSTAVPEVVNTANHMASAGDMILPLSYPTLPKNGGATRNADSSLGTAATIQELSQLGLRPVTGIPVSASTGMPPPPPLLTRPTSALSSRSALASPSAGLRAVESGDMVSKLQDGGARRGPRSSASTGIDGTASSKITGAEGSVEACADWSGSIAHMVAQRLSNLTDPEAVGDALESEEVGVYRAHVARCTVAEPSADKRRLKVFTGRASVERKEFGTAVRQALIGMVLWEARKAGAMNVDTVDAVIERIKRHAEDIAAAKKAVAMERFPGAISTDASDELQPSVGGSSAMTSAPGTLVVAMLEAPPPSRSLPVSTPTPSSISMPASSLVPALRGAAVRARKNRGSAAWRSALRKEMYVGYKRELQAALALRAVARASAVSSAASRSHVRIANTHVLGPGPSAAAQKSLSLVAPLDRAGGEKRAVSFSIEHSRAGMVVGADGNGGLAHIVLRRTSGE